ncbi:PAS sensor protein [Streptacidiphilus pinicola]|uniref:protein-serine/threonine phosphatase n=1 Tax=Streptacidiphilus pinicola TaxID=2219663 RepID=A0A2X0IKE0_9ACTN|nr:SpoIIE family protein phosphatase [Streptacidiphilus pinicola]RAG85552.1 PAS sensor protein [Streptacidiphilus pinicola]
MSASDADLSGRDPEPIGPSLPGGLLDLLGVAAALLDGEGRIVLWSPQARELFGWSADEALGRYAAKLLVAEENVPLILELFAKVMASGDSWAGVFPIRHKDGSTRLVEFRNMRLRDKDGARYALGIAADESVVRGVERDLALSARLVTQSPIGLAVLDTDLRYVLVNPALEHINGIPARLHLGRTVAEVLPFLDAEAIQAVMREVLSTGTPLLEQFTTGSTPADPGAEHAWLVSYYRLDAAGGRVIGVALSIVDVTEQHRADQRAAQARRRLALIARASARIGTTLDLGRTARELADTVVPDLADMTAIDILDAVLQARSAHLTPTGPADFRALAVKAAYPTEAAGAADPVGEISRYAADRLVTRSATTGRPVHIPHVRPGDLARIARDEQAAAALARAGVHSYLAVPLTARGEVLGVLDMVRARNPVPFDADDVLLAEELAARAAVCIDNARWYQTQRDAATALQRHLLPQIPPHVPGLNLASRYQPAGAPGHAGGDWFDVIPLGAGATALVVGDVMGHDINAAATMGQLRTAGRTMARLGLEPAEILRQLDQLTEELEETIATCVCVLHEPVSGRCRIALAGHPPPVLHRPDRPAILLDLPPGAPLGAAAHVPLTTTGVDLPAGARLFLYTDGLVEQREQAIDVGLNALLDQLTGPWLPLDEVCDKLLAVLPGRKGDDDVALLVAEAEPRQGPHQVQQW